MKNFRSDLVLHQITSNEDAARQANEQTYRDPIKYHRVKKLDRRWTYIIMSYVDSEWSF